MLKLSKTFSSSSSTNNRIVFGVIYVFACALIIGAFGFKPASASIILPLLSLYLVYEASAAVLAKNSYGRFGVCLFAIVIEALICIWCFGWFQLSSMVLLLGMAMVLFLMVSFLLLQCGIDGVQAGLTLIVLISEIVLVQVLLWQQVVNSLQGYRFVIAVLVIPAVIDTLAYLGGSLFGKRKMGVAVSPNKTWVGFGAGLMVAPVIVWVFVSLGYLPLPLPNSGVFLRLVVLLVYGMAVGLVSQFGDWFASGIKRLYGIKDFANVMPGHGGLLDRLDSVMPTIILLQLFLNLRR